MVQRVSEPVSVSLSFDCEEKRVFPACVVWKSRRYPVTRVGLHHTYRKGRTLYHVFSVVSKTLFLRLVLNTESLFWRLEEVADGF